MPSVTTQSDVRLITTIIAAIGGVIVLTSAIVCVLWFRNRKIVKRSNEHGQLQLSEMLNYTGIEDVEPVSNVHIPTVHSKWEISPGELQKDYELEHGSFGIVYKGKW